MAFCLLCLTRYHIVLDAPGADILKGGALLLVAELPGHLTASEGTASKVHTIEFSADWAFQTLFVANHLLETVGVEKVSFALWKSDNLDWLFLAFLLLVELGDFSLIPRR